MNHRRSPRLRPQIQASEDGAGMARRRSPRLHPRIKESEDGGGVARRRSPRLHPQIQESEDGARVTCHHNPRLHPQIHASEEGAGVAPRRILRRRGKSPAEPVSLPDDDDLLREILVRLPPQPSSLPRASAVCKRWRGLVTDPNFHRQFCAHHQKPPILGFFQASNEDEGIVFNPVLDPPDRIPPRRFDLVGNCLYWLSAFDGIIEFDLDENSLTVTRGPPVTKGTYSQNRQIVQAADGAVGYAILGYPRFKIWQRNIDGHGVATWIMWKTIEMNTIPGLPPRMEAGMGRDCILGYDEDTDEMFLYVNCSVYMVQLKLLQSRKLYEGYDFNHLHYFKSFFTPGTSITG